MSRSQGRRPPFMQRTLRHDLTSGLAVLLGFMLGDLMPGAGDVSSLRGAVVGVLSVIVVSNVLRRIGSRRRT